MLEPKNKWPSTKLAKNILFVAQLSRELLDPDTFESNRVFSLDTLSRLKECIRLYDDLEKNRIPEQALRLPFEEACWSVKIDPVVSNILKEETIDTLSIELKNKDSFSKPYLAAVYLSNKLTPVYKSNLENQMLDSLNMENRRNYIRRLVSYYCSYLINIGYSRDYILESIDERFFAHDHARLTKGKVKQFFKLFSDTEDEYYVYAEVSNDFGKLLSGVGLEVKKQSESLERHNSLVKSQFKIGKINSYAFVEANAMDNRSALTYVNEVLVNVRALSFLHPDASNVTWERSFYVVRKRQKNGNVLELPDSPVDWLSPQTTSNPRILNDIKRYSNRIIENFDHDSVYRILKSVSTASSARYAPSVEAQLIALWSAVEGLLSEPLKNNSRISHFSNLMLPCICNRHLHRRAVYLYDQLNSVYRHRFRRIINQEPDFREMFHHYRFTAIMMFDSNKMLRDKLLKLVENNPLALNRLHQFYEDCNNPKNLSKAIESHEKRVKWQISRIYRVRNSLVHKAEKPGYTDSVVLNLFEYYIRTLSCVVRAAAKTKDESNLDQIVSGIYLDSISMKRHIKRKFKANKNDVELFHLLHV